MVGDRPYRRNNRATAATPATKWINPFNKAHLRVHDVPMWVALISALALIFTSAATILLTKAKERAAEWRAKKLAYYEEFISAGSGIVGKTAPPEAKIRFATAVNDLHLIA